MGERITRLIQAFRRLRGKSYDAVQYLTDDDPRLQGWYIVSYDPDGYSYDCVGPYDSEKEAYRIHRTTSRRG